MRVAAIAAGAAGVLTAGLVISANSDAATQSHRSIGGKSVTISSTGLRAGMIKHVWLIILENKSYDATFTGLNQNSYLWKTLPSQGVLLKNYYGTGHFSQDNYESMVSGQAPEQDTQSDCDKINSDFGSNATIINHGANRGQVLSSAGPNAADGMNGCTYPAGAPTLFNQLDAAKKTWKGYAQDLHNQAGREDASCGGPGTSSNNPTSNPLNLTAPVQPNPVVSYTGAQPNDQYVAKHFPFPWFHSLIGSGAPGARGLTRPVQGGTDCDANHIANLDDATHGLFHDLQKESRTPAFSWITPNNCSDAHDAICKGNNLSGSFTGRGKPIYQSPTPDPESTTPRNQTGGLYASDLFLKYYIPMIEKSAAFKDGGLIDITFDEANPPFTYTRNSFNNADQYGPTLGDKPNAAAGLAADAAGENRFGRNVHSEPAGPNTPLKTDAQGNQLYPGPGDNAFIDRPATCSNTVTTACVSDLIRGGAGSVPLARTDTAVAAGALTFVLDPAITELDTGRPVSDTVDTTGPGATSPIPADTFVGAVSNTGPLFPKAATGTVVESSFQLVDSTGTPVTPTGAVSSITLGAEGVPGSLQPGQTADPLYDATHATPGGGDTGSVLISPYIKPGTSTSRFYDHYSWLRTMEDIFAVSSGHTGAMLPVGTVAGGLDGKGHLGFAAERGLAPFGPDVFNHVPRVRHRKKHR